MQRLIPPLIALALAVVPAVAQAQLNLYCSSPNTAWCQGMANGFEKATGTQVSVIQKATGEMFAQIKPERANPKGDIWWAGPADSFLQAADDGLLEEYRSASLWRHPGPGLQHRDRRKEKTARAQMLEGSRQSRL